MAFFSKLNANRQAEIYAELQVKVSEEANAMYNANSKKAGQYKGLWFELLDLWMHDKIPNFHVTDCLRINSVLTYDLQDAIELHKAWEKQQAKTPKFN
jgi:hypothetical protein